MEKDEFEIPDRNEIYDDWWYILLWFFSDYFTVWGNKFVKVWISIMKTHSFIK